MLSMMVMKLALIGRNTCLHEYVLKFQMSFIQIDSIYSMLEYCTVVDNRYRFDRHHYTPTAPVAPLIMQCAIFAVCCGTDISVGKLSDAWYYKNHFAFK